MTVEQCLETLLWSSTDDNDEPLDGNYEVSPQLRESLARDWQEFLDSLPEGFCADDQYIGRGDADEMLAHDYILTRNRHGAGFWDGDWGKEMGETLTKLAQAKFEMTPYVGDDGLIYSDY